MPFVPHTEADVAAMLDVIGVDSIDALFDEIPPHLANGRLDGVPESRSELEVLRALGARAAQDDGYTCFLGGGSYDHHIPAAVWDLTSRGEFMTAYTPYQAEASQGTLQLIYEYQSMMAALTGLDVANASVYDGASGLAEAVLMAARSNKKNKSRQAAMLGAVHPNYVDATRNIVGNQGLEVVTLPCGADGTCSTAELETLASPPCAVVISQPNFLGRLEAVDEITDWAHAHNVLVIALVNPMSLAVLKPPGDWGQAGADIACGDGQPFGVPMASGGPSFGFMCCRDKLVRQMPGRIIGRTEDLEGRVGYALTLQAREQHIRRGKATSNICTNQGLLVTAGTIYMSLLGPQGLRETAIACHRNAMRLKSLLCAIDGVEPLYNGAEFHEFGLRLPRKAAEVSAALQQEKILPGLVLSDFLDVGVADADQVLLIAVTEKRTEDEMQAFAAALGEVL
ncbi:MAG: aminomethyl-transferring glycine dehydrogenase subunit GcvPA [Pseudomonadota bacterium]